MSFSLSAEQQRIVNEAKPPSINESSIVRVTAAAGTGKTTTLLKLAKRLSDLGHTSITYITFNKSAAADARARLVEAGVSVDARTLHSCAMSLLAKSRQQEEATSEEHVMLEEALQKEIERRVDVDAFLGPCYAEIARKFKDRSVQNSKRQNAQRQVYFYIFKSLKQFCQSNMTLESWSNPLRRQRNYYPATMYHKKGGDGEEAGFLPSVYENRIGYYADTALTIWNQLSTTITYDMEMKRAQLAALDIPGTALLVDECQDMDACQVDWVANQQAKQIYFVGDAAQTIYSFRGAKSRFMMNLKQPVTDCPLTTSWRFGPNVAQIANIVLFAKERSPQTTGNRPGYETWKPYRLTGGGKTPGTVTSDPLLPSWKSHPVTLLAFSNVELLTAAVAILGYVKPDSEKENDDMKKESTGVKEENTGVNGMEETAKTTSASFNPNDIPKFHINGKGENSGMRKWKQILKQLEHLYDVYTVEEGGATSLPPDQFPEFANQKVDWASVKEQVANRELNRYAASIMLIDSFKTDTMQVIEVFKENVINKSHKAADADVILSTCHSAKGMEWDNVQVCSDFCTLATLDGMGPPLPSSAGKHAYKRIKGRNTWQFSLKPYGDDVNLLYVACTRAKKRLSVPKVVKQLLQECDLLHELLAVKKTGSAKRKGEASTVAVFGSTSGLSDDDLNHIYTDVVQPLRTQCQVKTQMVDVLFCEGESDGSSGGDAIEIKTTPKKKAEPFASKAVIEIDDSPPPAPMMTSSQSADSPEVYAIDC